ncbi:hypothetical protein [uncultured Rikenella sp.]|uniref:hypothetical protein n=1 Tax=uncultured Rikenella sp. TaxID=368003 RepID=UPI00272AF2BE|nr:hypothetical protein [uncultured Rikenella sp.]
MKRECTAFVEDKNSLSVRTVQAIGQSAVSRFPAPGYRDAGNEKRFGDLGSAGNHGASWSSTNSSVEAIYLYFHSTIFHPNRALHRGYGFQLRCLSE